mmetsp:Transcript_11426/g.33146  ORF Transcript_11426/g.33146 Transcript_11426/m.33146 type:complete len:126 (+) Transcript_11426:1136-1513(+)
MDALRMRIKAAPHMTRITMHSTHTGSCGHAHATMQRVDRMYHVCLGKRSQQAAERKRPHPPVGPFPVGYATAPHRTQQISRSTKQPAAPWTQRMSRHKRRSAWRGGDARERITASLPFEKDQICV